jgi:uncharacterized membrane protein (UPF0182 family)
MMLAGGAAPHTRLGYPALVGDLFDEFMRELRRRQGGGEEPGGDEPGEEPGGPGRPERSEEPRPIRRGGPRRPRQQAGGARRALRGYLVAWILVVVLLALLLFGRGLVDLWTDVLWYRSVGFEDVLWTRLGAQIGLFVLGAVVALAVLLGNLWLAGRLGRPPADGSGGALRGWVDRLSEAARNADLGGAGGPWGPRGPGPRPVGPTGPPTELPDVAVAGRWILAGFAVLVVIGAAGGLSSAWETILLWQHRVPFSPDGTAVTDPVFGRDIGFFFFELPFLRLLQATVVGLAVASLVIAAGRYAFAALGKGLELSTQVRLHLGILGGIYLLAIAYGYQLDRLELAYSTRGVGVGVSYTDAAAQFLAYDVLTVLSGLAAALVVGGAFTRWFLPLGLTVVVWFLASILIGRLYPEAIQRLVVDPNEFAQEQRYIENNISMTRLAFGFANPDRSAAWDDSRRYEGNAPLSQAVIDDEEATFRNARLWDYRPLGNTLDQLQTIRRYYDFFDVDTDRYVIGDVERQVMLSARELDLSGNPRATGFVNQRIIFTHGIGVAMVPVNEVAGEGQPRLFIRNLPPVSNAGAPEVKEPRLYFGERPADYVIVGAKQAEFDYPRGEEDPGSIDAGTETRWRGTTGVPLRTTLDRLLFAIRFGSLDLLITDQITSSSQLLFHRSLGDRVPRIAPFLRYDKDPYIVIDGDGGLTYVWDAYTTSDLFPHANWFFPAELGPTTGLAGEPFNYLRNSVKVTIDAYDGTMRFYVADPTDPLIRAWQGVFPTVFRPLSELPADLASHLRVPEEQFNVQTRMYGQYHVVDPRTFYSGDDTWMVPTAAGSEQSVLPEAYYVIMRMPGESEAEFLLLQPMVPTNRPNMIAWVAARNDLPNYGDVRVYRFPVDTTVFGPAQIEARIDQDPVISAQFTLWGQAGSSVIRGNLIVVPVGDSLLYLQPIYLQSTASSFPEFQRIIVASATEVVWAPTLGESLRLLLEAQGGPSPTPTPSPGPTPTPSPGPTPTAGPSPTPGPSGLPTDVNGLIDYANTHFELAQQALRDGDFARYGEEIALVEAALQRLDELTGG